MKVLVAHGSKMGGTEGIARILGEVLSQLGHRVEVRRADEVVDLAGIEAVLVGGGLYAGRWQRDARRFVRRYADELRGLPVFFFSSGPLDDSAVEREIPPTPSVRQLITLAGAREHVTFGGRLDEDAKGFIAHRMAKAGHAGDWRDVPRIAAWGRRVADELEALPGPAPVAGGGRARRAVRWVTGALCTFTGITAALGGLELMGWPNGASWLPALDALEHTPFKTFFLPGLVLFAVVGLPNLVAAFRLSHRHPRENQMAFAAGALLTGWIVSEMLLLRMAYWLQLVYLAVGLATLLLTGWLHVRRRRGASPSSGGRQPARAG